MCRHGPVIAHCADSEDFPQLSLTHCIKNKMLTFKKNKNVCGMCSFMPGTRHIL